jgi:class 3 adenylate cyclase
MSGLSDEEFARQTGSTLGQTVNLASRIADYARPREILVSGDISLRGVVEPWRSSAQSFVTLRRLGKGVRSRP